MSTIDRQIAAIKPRIELVSPIAGWSILVFGVFNVLLGAALFFFKARLAGEFSLVNYIFNYQFWGVLFFLVGAFQLWAFRRNTWNIMRKTLLVTVSFSAMWAVALSMRFFFGNYDNVFLLLVWLSLTAWKVIVFIFFMPAPPKEAGNG